MSASLKNHLPGIAQSMGMLKSHIAKNFGVFMRRLFAILVLGVAAFGASPAFSQATVSYQLNFGSGWNLLGNSLNSPIDVGTTYSDGTKFTTVWKWIPGINKWAFYAPSLVASGTLASYCASKGYSVLTNINPGESYWVNATQAVNLGSQTGQGYFLGGAALQVGWNLLATADNVSPAAFNRSLGTSVGSFPPNISTLWAWDSTNSMWNFYAPSLDAQGGAALTNYITSKGYKDFRAQTVGQGRGVWANVPAPIVGATSSYTYVNKPGTVTYTPDAVNATVYSNFTTTVNFTTNVATIPPGATVSLVTEVYTAYLPTPNGFAAGLCPDSILTGCEDITRLQSFSTTRFNGRSPALGYVMAFTFTGANPPPPSIGIWGYSVTANFDYPFQQLIATPAALAVAAAPASKLTGSSGLIAPAQTGVVVDPLAPPPSAGH